MKIKLLIAFITLHGIVNAQGVWTQKTDFGGTGRAAAVGFSIGTKAYIGTGTEGGGSSGLNKNDFWEWDQLTDTWTQRTNFPGTARSYAVGFSIGGKGYIGTGYDGTDKRRDFWEWDQATNAWMQKADFGGTARYCAVGFSINDKGYIGTGYDDNGNTRNDFWEWDQASDTWVQKTNIGNIERGEAIGFSIGTKGYIGTGLNASSTLMKDFWEWDQTTDTWIQVADFGGTARRNATGFNIGTKGYIGTGYDGGSSKKDMWEWDQANNVWLQKADFGGTTTSQAVGFSIGTIGYVGTGQNATKDFWAFDPGSVSGIGKAELDNSVSVYPNPASEFVALCFIRNNSADLTLNIYNAIGELVKSEVMEKQQKINIGDLNNGIYMVEIKSKEGSKKQKLIIQR